MIRRPTPLNIKQYQPKLLFGLNKYQLLSVSVSIAVVVSMMLIFKGGDSLVPIIVSALCCLPFLALGWITIRHQPLLKTIKPTIYEHKNNRYIKKYQTGHKTTYRTKDKAKVSAKYKPVKI